MIDLHLSAFAPRWRFLYAVRIDAYIPKAKMQGAAAIVGCRILRWLLLYIILQ